MDDAWKLIRPRESSRRHLWIGQLCLTIAVGVAYFFATEMSLALVTKPYGVAVFWPAAGISSGTLIALGSRVSLPVTLGVVTSSTEASLIANINLAAATVFALSNAGEPLLVAWLIQRQFGENFRLESLRSVVGFFMAAGVGPAASASVATVGFILFYSSTAPVLTTWLNWFASDALGIIVVAPLLIGLAGLRDNLPRRWELAHGTLTLVALAVVSALAFRSSARHWFTAFPLAVLLLILLAAHCRLVFAAAAALILGFAVVGTMTFAISGVGELPDLHDRAYAARATLLAISTCTLVLAALFAERRQKEAALKDSNDRLELALDCAELGTWRLHLKSGRFENDERDRHIHGHGPDAPAQTLAEMRSHVHPEDLSKLDAAFAALRRAGGSCRTEYRLTPRPDDERVGRARWVAIKGAVVRGRNGRPLQLLGVTQDITGRKQAEQALAERNAQFELGRKVAQVGSFTYDYATRTLQLSPTLAAIYGLPEHTPEISREEWQARVHPDDLPHIDVVSRQALANQQGELVLEFRIVRPDGAVRWTESRILISYGDAGRAVHLTGANIDITERKQMAQALSERNIQLSLAAKAGLVGTFAYDTDTEIMQISEGYAVLHGFPEGTTEMARSKCLARVHSDDIGRVVQFRSDALRERRREYNVEYRLIRPGGEWRWVETRCFVSYSSEGRPHRVIGVCIDITERKRVEEQQQVLLAELDHRVKNTLATVSAVVAHTLDSSNLMQNCVMALNGRIRAMATTHELLSACRWQGVSLTELVRRELAPYAAGDNSECSPVAPGGGSGNVHGAT